MAFLAGSALCDSMAGIDDDDLRCSIYFDMRSLFETSCRADPSDPNDRTGADFTFTLVSSSPSRGAHNDITFRAHRCILASRSPYFYSLFSQPETAHSRNETLFLTNVSPEVLEKILYHIYTDDVLTYSLEEASQMQVLAQKYGLRKLENDIMKRTSRSRVFRSSNAESITFHNFINNPLLSDITIVCPLTKEKIYAHRAILGSRGRYFRSVFSGIYKDSSSPEIALSTTNELTKDQIERILEYLYTDSLSFHSLKDALEMMQVSHYFLLPGMQYLCEEYISDALQADNVNFLWKLSRCLPKSPLIEERCEKYLVDNMETIMFTTAFLHFDKEFLLKVLSSGELDINVVELTEAILRWGQANIERVDAGTAESLEFHSVHDGIEHIVIETDNESNSDTESDEEQEQDARRSFHSIEPLLPIDLERVQTLIVDLLPPKTMFNREIRQSILANNNNNLFFPF